MPYQHRNVSAIVDGDPCIVERTEFHVVMRVISSIHADYCGRRAPVWKHSDQDQVGVMDPVELVVPISVKASVSQHVNASVCGWDIRVKLVVGVLRGMYICHRTLVGVGICCN